MEACWAWEGAYLERGRGIARGSGGISAESKRREDVLLGDGEGEEGRVNVG